MSQKLLILLLSLGYASLIQYSPKSFLQINPSYLDQRSTSILSQQNQQNNTIISNQTSDGKEYIIVDDDIDDDLIVSERIVQKAEEGKHFFFLISDQTSVWVYDPITNIKNKKLVDNLSNIIDIAVDRNRNYLFVADHQEGNNKSIVMKYHFQVYFQNSSDVSIYLLPNQTFKVYDGENVTGIDVDDNRHLLFIAESKKKVIFQIDFSDTYKPLGNATVLYQGLPSMSNLQGVVCDEEHQLVFWGNSENGSKNGGVLQANYSGITSSVQVLNNLEVINDIAYEDDQLYYIANGNEIYTQDHEATIPKPILMSKGFFTNAFRIGALDGYIYVTDEKKGLYVIKTFDDIDDPFDDPVKIDDFKNDLKSYRGFTVLRSSGNLSQAFVSVFTVMVSLIIFIY